MLTAVSIGFLAVVLAGLLLAMQMPAAAVLAGIAIVATLLIWLLPVPVEADEMLAGVFSSLFADGVAMLTQPELWALPLAVLLGNLAFYGGIATRIHDAAALLLRRVPGGLAVAAILGCGGFAAMTGSSVSCASTMGRICVPEMLRSGYDPRLATGSVAVGGTLGALIPPSILFVLFGLLSGAPIGHLFIAGLLPGLMTLVAAVLAVMLWVRSEPGVAPLPGGDDPRRWQALSAIWPAILLLVVLIAALLAGLGIVAALLSCTVLALVIGLVLHRLTGAILWLAFRESALQLAGLLVFLVAAALFYGMVTLSGLGVALTDWALLAGLSPVMAMLVLAVICLILGMFIEPVGLLALILPLLVPLSGALGMELIWVGVILVKLLEIGLITPPVGMNVFVIGNVVPAVRTGQVFAGVMRFLLPDLLVLLILILFPALVLFLPGLIR